MTNEGIPACKHRAADVAPWYDSYSQAAKMAGPSHSSRWG